MWLNVCKTLFSCISGNAAHEPQTSNVLRHGLMFIYHFGTSKRSRRFVKFLRFNPCTLPLSWKKCNSRQGDQSQKFLGYDLEAVKVSTACVTGNHYSSLCSLKLFVMNSSFLVCFDTPNANYVPWKIPAGGCGPAAVVRRPSPDALAESAWQTMDKVLHLELTDFAHLLAKVERARAVGKILVRVKALLPVAGRSEDIGTCQYSCQKYLECEQYRCSERCTVGKFDQCLEMVRKVVEPLNCDLKCKNVRSCWKYLCDRKCRGTKRAHSA